MLTRWVGRKFTYVEDGNHGVCRTDRTFVVAGVDGRGAAPQVPRRGAFPFGIIWNTFHNYGVIF